MCRRLVLRSYYLMKVTVFTVFAVCEQLGIILDAVPVVIVLDCGFNGLFGKNGAVEFIGGQSIKCFNDRLIGERKSLLNGLALDEFRRH